MRTIHTITFDFETIPGEHKPEPSEIKPPKNYTNPESILKYQEENVDKEWRSQSLSPVKGRVHSIGWKVNNEPTKSIWHDGTKEKNLFKRWEAALAKTFRAHYGDDTVYGVTWVGFNIKRFDIPYAWLRAKKYKCDFLIKLLGQTPRDIKMEDLMLWATVNVYGEKVSLDAACKLFGLKGKGDFNGSMVCDAWLRGENKEIGEYVKDDVDQEYALGVCLGAITPE